MEPKHFLPGAALLSLVSGPAGAVSLGTFTVTVSASAPSPAGSTGLGPNGPVGGVLGGAVSFNAPFAGTLTMQVADFGQQGDVYQAFVNGHSLGFTAAVPLDIIGTNLSTGTFTTPVAAGANTFDLNDQILSFINAHDPYGSNPPGGFVPASYSPGNVTVTLTELPGVVRTPEPGTLAVLCSWLLGLGALGRFWKTRQRA